MALDHQRGSTHGHTPPRCAPPVRTTTGLATLPAGLHADRLSLRLSVLPAYESSRLSDSGVVSLPSLAALLVRSRGGVA